MSDFCGGNYIIGIRLKANAFCSVSRITSGSNRLRVAGMSFACAKATPVPSWSFCFAGGHSAMLAAHPRVIQIRDPKNGLDMLITFPEKSPNH
jgi:hypothetical protein